MEKPAPESFQGVFSYLSFVKSLSRSSFLSCSIAKHIEHNVAVFACNV